MENKHSFIKSFGYAFEGIKTAFREEWNFKIHIVIAIVAIFLGFYLKINSTEWFGVIFSIFFVLIMELINTAIETVVNISSPGISKKAKIAKDVSAAAVLLGAIFATFVGVMVFLPKLLLII